MRVRENPDIAAELMAEAVHGLEARQLLFLGWGAGFLPVAASVKADAVLVADRNLMNINAARSAAKASDLQNATFVVSHGSSRLAPDVNPDVICLRVPRDRLSAMQLIRDSYEFLPVRGMLYTGGGFREGIKPYLRQVDELFGSVETLAVRKGYRVALAMRGQDVETVPEAFNSEFLDHDKFLTFHVELGNESYVVHSRPGIFSWDHLDAGSRALIDAMEIRPEDSVLDLGCGYGIVGAVAARLAYSGAVTMVDADIEAVESTLRTISANHLRNCEALLSDAGSELGAETFDAVVTNPPFHSGRDSDTRIAKQFISASARVLRPQGRLFLVANKFLPYEKCIRAAFGNVGTAYSSPSYKVLVARK